MQRHGSHTVLLVRDMEERIGFQFMHCNNRDHSIASGAATKKRINDLMFEFEKFDDVGLALEAIECATQPTLLIHSNREENKHV